MGTRPAQNLCSLRLGSGPRKILIANLPPLDEREGSDSKDDGIPSNLNNIKADGQDSKPAPFERPIPIMDTSSTITTPRSLFDITSSRKVSLDYTDITEPISSVSVSCSTKPMSTIAQAVISPLGEPKAAKSGDHRDSGGTLAQTDAKTKECREGENA
jgi:hypothetical protein